MASMSRSSKFITFDNFVIGHLHLWHFSAILPENYITREKLRGWLLKVTIAFHVFCIGIYCSTYLCCCILMVLKAEFDSDFICEFLIVMSVSIRYILYWSRRRELSCLLDKCRDLWSYVRHEEKILVKPYERIVYFFRLYCIFSAFGCLVNFTIFAYFVYFEDADGNVYRQNALK